MTYKVPFTHGLMFHHFHDEDLHLPSQGSIDKDQFYNLIKFVGRENILNAEEYYHRFENNKLKPSDTCLTFDDSLLCQYDVALPIMEELKIRGFWFIYSAPFFGKLDRLKIYRYFRHHYFAHLDEFYSEFFKHVTTTKNLETFFNSKNKEIKNRKKINPFYTLTDIKFRLVRDDFLNKDQFENIMRIMMTDKQFDEKKAVRNLYFTNKHLKYLANDSHLLGLHSYNHPTKMENLDYESQKSEYLRNLNHLKKIAGKDIKAMSHPCCSYDGSTIQILEELDIGIAFRANMFLENGMKIINPSKYEIAREDHTNIIKMMSES